MDTSRFRRATPALALACLAYLAGLLAAGAQAQTLVRNATGTHDGFYYTFWKDSGEASMTLMPGGRYTSPAPEPVAPAAGATAPAPAVASPVAATPPLANLWARLRAWLTGTGGAETRAQAGDPRR